MIWISTGLIIMFVAILSIIQKAYWDSRLSRIERMISAEQPLAQRPEKTA